MFQRNTVAYDEGEHRELEEAVILRDAISDLPAVSSSCLIYLVLFRYVFTVFLFELILQVTNNETREQMAYQMPPETEFQKYMRLTKDGNEILSEFILPH